MSYSTQIKNLFKKITKSQAKVLATQISVNFVAGMEAGKKHQSINYQLPNYTKSVDTQDESLTDTEKEEIALLVATYLAYLQTFNTEAQGQALTRVKNILAEGGAEQDAKDYLSDLLTGKETITIDNVGKKKKEIYVDKDLKLSEVETTITKPYVTTLTAYGAMLGATVAHVSYEAGKKTQNINDGMDQWVFVGPSDERARPWHVALLGQVYEYGSQQSAHAERCLQEPRCRHRAEVWYGDSRDTPAEFWEKQKEEAGLHWDEKEERWALKERVTVPKTPKTKVEKENTKAPKGTPKKEKPVKEVKKKEVKEQPKEVKRTPEDVQKKITDHEREIKDKKVEHGAVFSNNGDLLIKKVGEVDHITWTREEREVMKSTILTHTHPNNAGFSPADVKFACGNGLKEMRAVGPTRVYSMHFVDGRDFTPEDWIKLESKFEHNYQMAVAKERLKYKNNADPDKKFDKDKVTEHVANYAWSKTVKEIEGLRYAVGVSK